VTFLESIKTCLIDKPFTFSGRSSRSEFWWFVLFCFLIGCLIGPATNLFFPIEKKYDLLTTLTVLHLNPTINPVEKKELTNQYLADWFKPEIIPFAINVTIILFLVIIVFSVTCRRLHDINKSGWWQLISVPLIILSGVLSIVSYFVPLAFALYNLYIFAVATGAAFGAPIIWGVLLIILFCGLIPLIWVLWMTKEGTPGPNRFGEDPLRRDDNAPITAHISE
jgi:uncharacterized membrane protein YhaH (DUF805 family)